MADVHLTAIYSLIKFNLLCLYLAKWERVGEGHLAYCCCFFLFFFIFLNLLQFIQFTSLFYLFALFLLEANYIEAILCVTINFF